MLRAERTDPRDQTLEYDEPSYRVFFWSVLDATRSDSGWLSDVWELFGADIDEVLAWVQQHSDGRRASLWAVARSGGNEVEHTRLAGTDPTATDDTWPSWARADWPR